MVNSVFSTPAGQTNRVHFGTNTNFDKVQTSWRLVGRRRSGTWNVGTVVRVGSGCGQPWTWRPRAEQWEYRPEQEHARNTNTIEEIPPTGKGTATLGSVTCTDCLPVLLQEVHLKKYLIYMPFKARSYFFERGGFLSIFLRFCVHLSFTTQQFEVFKYLKIFLNLLVFSFVTWWYFPAVLQTPESHPGVFRVCVFGPGLVSTDKMLFCEKCKIAFVTAFH